MAHWGQNVRARELFTYVHVFHSFSSIEESTKKNRLDEEIQYKRLMNNFFLNIEIKTTSQEEKKDGFVF